MMLKDVNVGMSRLLVRGAVALVVGIGFFCCNGFSKCFE
ncbi:hypothetical protein MGCS35823_01164 [Streptococcus dysgalactiae subsp. equisimilis]|uniref:Uncharacterized protein n=1 Tax=Streptococcus dysgalactiae subsp. equisimilis TaxID=119602 RepID=A0A9X8T4P8_STREQ|nr:hypothetical protein MGCS36089_01140 [Streptococcus dysgalactiae subsp. equisimilis]SQH09307.1 Uncharacterised protein [Streptococcus pyogenes]VTT18194.1 Uncharacterised protein [Streptococcus dysgalactiae]WEQ77891.1 hypothetical protein MGCS36083_01168 [Streptococcus dysgalactiae subsp. equisimilis]WEQ79992.1 hypothetical protein MGGS36055_01258 [Streptococcus dysgalactiae subsp. equisimilis]